MNKDKKKRLIWFLIYTIVAWSILIVAIIQIGPPPDEPSETEKSLGIAWSTTDFRPLLLIVAIFAGVQLIQ